MPRATAPSAPVYPAREDTALLVPFAAIGPGRWVLEIGSGQGAIALAAARSGARVVATDLNPTALAGLRRIARREGLPLDVVRTDLAAGLGRFDRVLANPPYLPTPAAARDPDPWVNLALDGGPDGLGPTRRILATLPEHLRPAGVAVVLFSSRQPVAGRAALIQQWIAAGGTARVLATRALGDEVLEAWELTAAGR
jgi:release factor glutamine methyltransferase